MPYDAIIVGAGPNGLTAAITLARAGKSVLVLEARETPGGAASSANLTLPGFVHDLGSAVHPLGVGSPLLRTLPLADYGLEWIHPPLPLAHPLDDGTAATLDRRVTATGASLGHDAKAYWKLIAPVAYSWNKLAPAVLGPLRFPRHPLALMNFGVRAIWPADLLARAVFRGTHARALFAGMAAHSVLPLHQPLTAAFGILMCALGHAVGWPIPRGGAQKIADALAEYLRSLGGEIRLGERVERLEQLPPARAILLDLAPRAALTIAGDRLTEGRRRELARFRHGPGAFKLDWALDQPIPWQASECARAGTLHLGGTLEEITESEATVWRGEHPEQPFVLLSQPSLFDPSRAPAGKHTAWAYCHVPNGSTFDMTDRIEAQVERFAPGFRKCILARSVMGPAALETFNANLIGGDVSGGVSDFRQLYTRPIFSLTPYRLAERLYLCSASTPPGGGVHGMCGYHAARTALQDGI